MFTLIQGDCTEELKKLPDNSADAIITSPPYNMNLRIRNGKYCSRQIVKELSTKYEGYPDNLPIEEYYQLNKTVIEEGLRISPIVFYNVQFLTGNKRAFYKLIGEFAEHLKEFIVWDKVNSQPSIGEGILNSRFEVILVFERENAISRCFKKRNFEKGTLENLWQIKRGNKPLKEHGAVFPEELVETIVKNFTNEGDTILDPFMGTGTTGVVALKEKRNFVGIELEKKYFDFAKNRIENGAIV